MRHLIFLFVSIFILSASGQSSKFLKNLNHQTDNLLALGQFEKAENLCIDALKGVSPKKKSTHLFVTSLLANVYCHKRDYPKATELEEGILKKLTSVYQKPNGEKAQILYHAATLYYMLGRFPLADSLFTQALKIKVNRKETTDLMYYDLQNGMGLVYVENGFYPKADSIFQKVLSESKAIFGENSILYAETLNNLASSKIIQGNPEALYDEQVAIKILSNHYKSNPLLYTETVVTYGQMLYVTQQFSAAQDTIENALVRFETLLGKKSDYYGFALGILGNIFRVQNMRRESENAFVESCMILRSKPGGYAYQDASILGNHGALRYELNRTEESVAIYREAIAVFTKYGAKPNLNSITAYANLATTYHSLGNTKEAEQSYLQILAIYKEYAKDKITSPQYNMLLNNLTQLYLGTNEFDKAEKYFNEELSHFEYQDSIIAFQEWYLRVFISGAKLLLFGPHKDVAKAESFLLKGLEMAKKNEYPKATDLYINYPQYLAVVYTQKGDTEKAITFFKEYLTARYSYISALFPLVSEGDRSKIMTPTFTEKRQSIYDLFYKFCITNQNTNPELLANFYNETLKQKGIILYSTQAVQNAILNSNDSLGLSLLVQWRSSKMQYLQLLQQDKALIQNAGIDMENVNRQIEGMETELTKRAGVSLTINNIKWQDIQQKLPSESAAIEMVRLKDYDKDEKEIIHYAALILTPETKANPICIIFENGAEMEAKYAKYAIATANPENIVMMKELYNLYWQPIAAQIGNAKTIYFSPAGVYHKINLNTLVNANGKFLIEDVDIHLLASTRDILLPQTEILPSQKNIVLLGNPNLHLAKKAMEEIGKKYQGSQIGDFYSMRGGAENNELFDLPHAETEVKSVADLLSKKGWQTQVYMGDSAFEERLKLVSNPTILHIASHGYFPTQTYNEDTKELPMFQSGLMLAGYATTQNIDTFFWHEDGRFTAYEASLLNLSKTELVVLSACGTGLGVTEDGEGVFGLQRGFRVAGAKHILMSLSNVKDNSTEELMRRFYELWLSGKSIHNALREAQIEMLNKDRTAAVRNWGSFIHLGI